MPPFFLKKRINVKFTDRLNKNSKFFFQAFIFNLHEAKTVSQLLEFALTRSSMRGVQNSLRAFEAEKYENN